MVKKFLGVFLIWLKKLVVKRSDRGPPFGWYFFTDDSKVCDECIELYTKIISSFFLKKKQNVFIKKNLELEIKYLVNTI